MAENKHTKEEILELLNCDLEKTSYQTYILTNRELKEWWIEIETDITHISALNSGYVIYKDDMELLLELMDILEEEEKETK